MANKMTEERYQQLHEKYSNQPLIWSYKPGNAEVDMDEEEWKQEYRKRTEEMHKQRMRDMYEKIKPE